MARLTVRVTPRASRNAIKGFDPAGALRLRVTAPPADGAANAAVARLLAEALHVPARDVVLISGAVGRTKVFEVPTSIEFAHERLSTPSRSTSN